MNKILKQILSVFIISLLSLTACNPLSDNNIPRSDQIVPDYTVSITGFTADDLVVEYGNSTLLRWNIKDSLNKVDKVFIDNGIGAKKAVSGSVQVTPKASTVYTLSVYVDGKVLYEKSAIITVITADGSEVKEAPGEEICDDEIDNDLDGKNNCDDADCAEFEACIQENNEKIYEFSSVDYQSEVTEGDLVTVSWESNFNNVEAASTSIELDRVYYDADGSIEFIAPLGEITIYLHGEGDNGHIETKEVIINSSEKEPFSAQVKFKVLPSRHLIPGQPYQIVWDVQDASYCNMDGFESCHRTESNNASHSLSSHTLTVTDLFGNVKEITIPLTISQIEDKSSTNGHNDLVDVVYTSTKGQYYLITKTAVLFYDSKATEDNPKVIVDGEKLESDILSFAVNSSSAFDDKYFIGTKKGIFKKSDDETDPQIIIGTYDNEGNEYYHVTELVVTESKILAAGSGQLGMASKIFEIKKDDSGLYGYTSHRFYNVDRSEIHNVYDFSQNPTDKNDVLIVTDTGAFITRDGGSNFESAGTISGSDIKSTWQLDGNLLVWSNNQIKEFNFETGSLATASTVGTVNNVIYFYKKTSTYFVLTAQGLKIKFSNQNQDTFLSTLFGDHDYKVIIEDYGVTESSETDYGTMVRTRYAFGSLFLDNSGNIKYMGFGGGFVPIFMVNN